MKTRYLIKIVLVFFFYGCLTNTQNKIPKSGLVAYYPFDNDFNDHSGNSFNGKVTKAVLVGKKNKACFFNGGNSFIEVAGIDSLKTVKQLTVSCWINPFTAKQYNGWISKVNNSGNNSQWRMGFSDKCANQVQLTIFNNNWSDYNCDYRVDMKKWYHAVYQIDNIEHKASIYINGKNIKTFEIGELNTSDGSLLLGKQSEEGILYCGLLDEVLIYNRLLTETEIQGLYGNFKNADKIDAIAIKSDSSLYHSPKPKLSQSNLESLDKLMVGKVRSNSLAGVEYLIANKNELIHHQAIGYRNIEKHDTLQKNSLFQIACTARPFTAAAVLMLAEKGLLSLKDNVSQYIPEFKDMKVIANDSTKMLIKAKREITIYDLLTGQSGIGYIPEYYQRNWLDDTKNLKEAVHKVSSMPLANQPGEGYQYGFTLVADRIVEIVSKMPFNEFLKQNLFVPLDMYDTDCYVPKEKINRFASVHNFEEGKIKLIEKAENSKNVDRSVPFYKISFVSTPPDYLKFAQMLLNKGKHKGKTILSEESVNLMTSNQLPDNLLGTKTNISNRGSGMFGWVANENTWDFPEGTYGKDGGGWISLFWMDKKNELIGIIFLQTNNNYTVISDFYRIVYNRDI